MRFARRDGSTGGALLLGLALALALPSAGALAAPRELGRVTSVVGTATAQQPGAEPRTLACGDPLLEGDLVVTQPASRLGALLGDVLTQLEPETALRVRETTADTPDATLERGRVRMLDPREQGAPARLAALDSAAAVKGNDVEAYVLVEKVGPYAMYCEWDAPLPVSRGDERLTAEPGQCVIAKPTEPLYAARAQEMRIALGPDQQCVDPSALAGLAADPAHHLLPGDVAAPPPTVLAGTAGLGSGNPIGPDLQSPQQCDSPVSGCGVFPAGMPGIFEPPPIGGGAPGSGGPLP
jgi:hypothetical protein